MRAARVTAVAGRVLIGTGVLILLFVAYQLWGTGLHEARAQRALTRDFERSLAATATTLPARPAEPAEPTEPPEPAPPPPPVEPGQPVALMRIPRITLERAVISGVGVNDLKQGPGHYPGTPLPGQPGNVAIAGHRTTYGAPFERLDALEPGDEILVTTLQGEFRYEVTASQVVDPSAVEVLAPTDDDRLTLTTCHPRFSARQRLIITAALVGAPAAAPPAPELPVGVEPESAPTVPTLADDALSGDPAARLPALLWGLVTALVGLLIWLAARRWRALPAYLLGAPAFAVVLFVFFEQVARLFPANI